MYDTLGHLGLYAKYEGSQNESKIVFTWQASDKNKFQGILSNFGFSRITPNDREVFDNFYQK